MCVCVCVCVRVCGRRGGDDCEKMFNDLTLVEFAAADEACKTTF